MDEQVRLSSAFSEACQLVAHNSVAFATLRAIIATRADTYRRINYSHECPYVTNEVLLSYARDNGHNGDGAVNREIINVSGGPTGDK